jgi:hypothetical protein
LCTFADPQNNATDEGRHGNGICASTAHTTSWLPISRTKTVTSSASPPNAQHEAAEMHKKRDHQREVSAKASFLSPIPMGFERGLKPPGNKKAHKNRYRSARSIPIVLTTRVRAACTLNVTVAPHRVSAQKPPPSYGRPWFAQKPLPEARLLSREPPPGRLNSTSCTQTVTRNETLAHKTLPVRTPKLIRSADRDAHLHKQQAEFLWHTGILAYRTEKSTFVLIADPREVFCKASSLV